MDVTPNTTAASKPKFIVRPANADDSGLLLQLIAPFVARGEILERTPSELSELLHTGYVALIDGKIVGFAALEIYSHKLAELRSLIVDPGYQGIGIGRELVKHCIALARLHDIFEVMAITAEDAFFQKCGFDFTLPGQKKALFLQTRQEY